MLVCQFGCSTMPDKSIEYSTSSDHYVRSSSIEEVQSVAVLDPLVDLTLHQLKSDPRVLTQKAETLAREQREDIRRIVRVSGIELQSESVNGLQRFRLQRLMRNLKQSAGEGTLGVVLPANGVLANQLNELRPADALLISEYTGWEKATDLKRKERVTASLYRMITLGLVKIDTPAATRQNLRMFLVDSATGETLWTGSATGELADTGSMTRQLLSRGILMDKLERKGQPTLRASW